VTSRIDSNLAESLLTRLAPSRSERVTRVLLTSKNVPLEQLLSWPNLEAT
jgi:hypothetical protein